MDRELFPLFSQPVYKSMVNINNIQVDSLSVNWVKNHNNWMSDNHNILDDPTFTTVAQAIDDLLLEYFNGIMQVSLETKIYTTESWLNKTETGEQHHRHRHQNSVVSGVVFLASEGNTGRLAFSSSQYDTFQFYHNETNLYNAKRWFITPTPGMIVLFPSSLEHYVEPYLGSTPRISLAFNTFVKGKISSHPLTKLTL